MKILSRRAAVLLVFILAFGCGVVLLLGNYLVNAPRWVQYPTNKHLFVNGQPKMGTVFDRNGAVLAQTVNGVRKYNDDPTVRTAVMQTVGDSNGDISTGVQVVFAKQLSGWNLLNGVYQYGQDVSDITLTLDANVCAAAYKALNGRNGTVGVYNYKTGEILCMVSTPSFDPQSPPDVKADPEKYNGVFVNRLLSSTFTPGSVFKLVTAAAAIDNVPNVGQTTFHCTGEADFAGGKVTCPTAHGYVSFKQALSDSCNVTFSQLAVKVGSSTLQKYAELAGFNKSLSVNGIPTAAGKADIAGAKGANLGWAGIGQYTDTANPLSFMAYVGAIANGGTRVDPVLLKGSTPATEPILSQNTAGAVRDMMRYDVLNNYGDGNYPGLKLCAKSGTAQLAKGQQPNAWFAGFMDRADCPLAFVVVIENGGAGSSQAGPVANKVLQAAVKSVTGK